MSRFVKKGENGVLYSANGYQCLEKLYDLENLNEQLYDVPLKFILKREHKQVYWNDAYYDVRNIVPYEEHTEPYLEILVRESDKIVVKTLWFKDYKNTWWISKTKEE